MPVGVAGLPIRREFELGRRLTGCTRRRCRLRSTRRTQRLSEEASGRHLSGLPPFKKSGFELAYLGESRGHLRTPRSPTAMFARLFLASMMLPENAPERAADRHIIPIKPLPGSQSTRQKRRNRPTIADSRLVSLRAVEPMLGGTNERRAARGLSPCH